MTQRPVLSSGFRALAISGLPGLPGLGDHVWILADEAGLAGRLAVRGGG